MKKILSVYFSILFVVFAVMFAMTQTSSTYPITNVFTVKGDLYVFTEDSIYQIEVEDEVDEYYFDEKGKIYTINLFRTGCVYGICGPNYIRFKNSFIRAVDDNGTSYKK